ncbi:hypothetical protein MRX96_057652 [Rhipicephalus microplus]
MRQQQVRGAGWRWLPRPLERGSQGRCIGARTKPSASQPGTPAALSYDGFPPSDTEDTRSLSTNSYPFLSNSSTSARWEQPALPGHGDSTECFLVPLVGPYEMGRAFNTYTSLRVWPPPSRLRLNAAKKSHLATGLPTHFLLFLT